MPVVLDHHLLVRVIHLALVPGGQARRLHAGGQLGQDVGPRLMGVDHAFQQGVGGHAVGAVQPGVGHLADGVEAGDVGLAVVVDHHAATGVVGRRYYGHGLLGDVDADRKAALVDGREVLDDEIRRLVADIQIHAVGAEPLHLVVDGAGDYVPRRQFGPLVEVRHKAAAVGTAQIGPFPAQGFGQQEVGIIGVEQAGGVELVELQVRHPAAGAPRHGDAVPRAHVRVGGVLVHLGGAAGGQCHETGADHLDLLDVAVPDIGAEHPVARQVQLAGGDEVDRVEALHQADVGVGADLIDQGELHRLAGGVRRVEDAAMAVTPFSGQVIVGFPLGILFLIEGHALLDQPLDGVAGVAGGELHHGRVTQPGAGVERVAHMGFDAVGLVEHGSDASLRIESGPLTDGPLAQNQDFGLVCQSQREGQTGGTAANDQYVAKVFNTCFHKYHWPGLRTGPMVAQGGL
ncbi:hypothetical protein D3C76_650220 [compost metagenome]